MNVRTSQGFTLIELMVVLVIMASIIGLVGGLTIDQFERTEARSEELSLKNQIQHIANRSFITGQTHAISFEGSLMQIHQGERLVKRISYEHLFFQPQVMTVFVTGRSNLKEIEYRVGDSTRTLDLAYTTEYAKQTKS